MLLLCGNRGRTRQLTAPAMRRRTRQLTSPESNPRLAAGEVQAPENLDTGQKNLSTKLLTQSQVVALCIKWGKRSEPSQYASDRSEEMGAQTTRTDRSQSNARALTTRTRSELWVIQGTCRRCTQPRINRLQWTPKMIPDMFQIMHTVSFGIVWLHQLL